MKKAYATMLSNGDGYLPGVEALGGSLKASGTAEPMVVMVTPEVRPATRARLVEQGWTLDDVEPIVNPNPTTQQMLPRFGAAYTKLRAWQLVDFDKVVLLDADTIVLQNVDDLFERPEIAAAPDFFLPDRFSSGVMVLEPGLSKFDRMVEALAASPSYDGGDQGFLNVFFERWYAMPVEHRLPVGYNMAHFIYQFMRAHPSTWDKLKDEIEDRALPRAEAVAREVDALRRLGDVVGRLLRRAPGEGAGLAPPPARAGGLVLRHARALDRGLERQTG